MIITNKTDVIKIAYLLYLWGLSINIRGIYLMRIVYLCLKDFYNCGYEFYGGLQKQCIIKLMRN